MSVVLQNSWQWFTDVAGSRRGQLACTAIVSGGAVAGLILSYQSLRRTRATQKLKQSIPPEQHDPVAGKIANFRIGNGALSEMSSLAGAHRNTKMTEEEKEDARHAELARRARQGDFDEELVSEQLARNRVFLTPEGLEKLRSSFIIVVGLGGVGSHCAAALVRSGVSKIRVIDFDQVSLSSLNRHSVATLADVGTPKVQCLQKRLEQIAPWVQWDCRNELFSGSQAPKQLEPWNDEGGQTPDFIVDAIDNIDTKVELLSYCYNNKLPVICSMGAGCKSDPTKVFIGDLSQSIGDPLSRSIRRRLKAQGISAGIPVVYSAEQMTPGKAALLPLPDEEFEKGKVGELSVLPDFRIRILPVLGTMPAVFGLCIANHIMLELSKYPRDDYLQSKGRDKMYDAVLAYLHGQEERLARARGEDPVGMRIPITVDDIGYLIEDVFKGKSVISQLPTRLVLTRWRKPLDSTLNTTYPGQKYSEIEVQDLVCMTKDEAAKHEAEVLKAEARPEEFYKPAVVELVTQRLQEEAAFGRYR